MEKAIIKSKIQLNDQIQQKAAPNAYTAKLSLIPV